MIGSFSLFSHFILVTAFLNVMISKILLIKNLNKKHENKTKQKQQQNYPIIQKLVSLYQVKTYITKTKGIYCDGHLV